MSKLNKLLNESLESYYWVGFSMADGWVTINTVKSKYKDSIYENEVGVFGIQLASTDYDHLLKLSNYIDVPIKSGTRNTNFKHNSSYCRIKVGDNINVPKIKEKFGIINKKTTNPPDWSMYRFTDDQILSLIIGYIDGDASIAKRNNSNSLHLSFQTALQWQHNLNFIKTFFEKYFNIPVRSKVLINNRNHATLSICRSKLIKKLKLFAQENDLPALKRKWDVVDVHNNTAKNTTRTITFKHESGLIETPVSVRRFTMKHNMPAMSIWKLTNNIIKEYNGWIVENE